MGYTRNLSNNFLIAMPSMVDPNFFRTVTYLCKHDDDGAMGIIFNQPLTIHLSDIAEQIGIKNADNHERCCHIPIYDGGPVNSDRGYILHSPYGDWQSTIKITEQIHLTRSQDILESIINGFSPDKFIIALGYAGWGKGQLEYELASNAWLNGPSDTSILFDKAISQRWHSSVQLMGFEMSALSNQIGHA